jgi:hypothetical protein
MELIERRGFPRREGPFQYLVPYLLRIESRGSTSVVVTGPGPSRNLTQRMELVLGFRVRVLHRDLRAEFVERRHTSIVRRGSFEVTNQAHLIE